MLSAPGVELVLPVVASRPVLNVANKLGSWLTSAGVHSPSDSAECHRAADLGGRHPDRGGAVAAVRGGRHQAGFASVHAVPMRAASTVLGALGLFGTGSGLNDADRLVA